VDSDNDGVADGSDSCPNTAAGVQVGSDGCAIPLDSDQDGVTDANDNCPDTAAGTSVDAVGCAIPVDSDNDGVNDDADDCPDTPAGVTVDSKGCSIPTDSDSDGVFDQDDTCPNTPMGVQVDENGCAIPLDSDADGVTDENDECPNTEPDTAVDVKGCPIPIDSDGDGVNDDQDVCPNTPADTEVDSSGCQLIAEGDNDEVSASNSKLVGGIASDRVGMTLYVFDSDQSQPGKSVCNGGCAQTWPPLLVSDGQPSGVNQLSSITRDDGTQQVTYQQRPLYFYQGDQQAGDQLGDQIAGWHSVDYAGIAALKALYDEQTPLEPIASFVRDDGVLVTRFGDRGRDRHAKDITIQDHYDHYLAHYWQYRTARIQLEDFVPNGESRIRASFITETALGAREFRVWFWGRNTTGQFHFNPQKEEEKVSQQEPGVVYVGKGTWNNDFEKISDSGEQHFYTLDIINKWENGGQFQPALAQGMNMEFEVSQFLLAPPAGARLNYYGTSYVYVIGQTGVVPFEWQRGIDNQGGSNDGTPIPAIARTGGDTTLGYNYSEEPAGRFMQMATNISPGNAQPFVQGRRVHHTNFEDGTHDERDDNPVWTEQIGKLGNHYINHSCAECHVRNGRALVADVGENLDKWVFKIADENGLPTAKFGKVLQPNQTGVGETEGQVKLAAWTENENGLRSPNYEFTVERPAKFSARIAPQLVGIGLLDAIPEATIIEWADELDEDNDGISGKVSLVEEPQTGLIRLGRFGYKAATFSLRHQVASALNSDMGVMTEMLPDPDCGSEQTSCGDTDAELDAEQLDDLIKYNSLLGVGARRDYAETSGETTFADLGCASCHRPSMQTGEYHPLAELRNQTIYPYTDLLLHDMGEGLADNLGEGSASGAEWRTAPLWGLGLARNVMLGDAKANDSVSFRRRPDDVNRIGYLHDGRARTIDEAIRWHGGEALDARNAYELLSDEDKVQLLAFLESL
jgi:CxxC motif-containing protein (DUF1111 family)/predicted lipoprotein with Yx(FWY)xxD motif